MLLPFTMTSALLFALLSMLAAAGAGAIGASRMRSEIAYIAYHEVMPDIFLADAERGIVINLTDHPAYDGAPAWSPDGSMIAFASDRDGTLQIYLMDASGRGLHRLTDSPLSYNSPRWTPDGRIVFTSLNTAGGDWYAIHPDGTGFEQIASSDEPITGIMLDLGIDLSAEITPRSPDNVHFLYTTWLIDRGEWGIFFASDAGRRDGQLLALTGRAAGEQMAWSPNGSYVAYIGSHEGTSDVYTVPIALPREPRRLTADRIIEAGITWRP